MRALILAISVLAILGGANAANAGPSTAIRDLSASVEPATVSTVQETEQPSVPDKIAPPGVQRARHRGGAHHHRIGGPVGLVGGMVAGLFGRR
jgi:hypothetical protein